MYAHLQEIPRSRERGHIEAERSIILGFVDKESLIPRSRERGHIEAMVCPS